MLFTEIYTLMGKILHSWSSVYISYITHINKVSRENRESTALVLITVNYLYVSHLSAAH